MRLHEITERSSLEGVEIFNVVGSQISSSTLDGSIEQQGSFLWKKTKQKRTKIKKRSLPMDAPEWKPWRENWGLFFILFASEGSFLVFPVFSCIFLCIFYYFYMVLHVFCNIYSILHVLFFLCSLMSFYVFLHVFLVFL